MHYTKRQFELMHYVCAYIAKNGIPPTLQEAGDHFGVSRVTIFEHLTILEKKGAIRRRKGMSRAIEILDDQFASRSAAQMPLLGVIAAGSPIEAIEDAQPVDLLELAGEGERYMLRVKGDSMIEEHLADGDYVIVEKRDTAEDGEIVVAIINDNEATLKRLYREKGRFRLEPANAAMSPIYVEKLDVRGTVIGVLRKY